MIWLDTALLFHLWVPGDPAPWTPPRVARFGGEIPSAGRLKMKGWQAEVAKAWAARPQDPKAPYDGPLSARVFFYLHRPHSRKKSEVWAETYADLDNMVKATLDALQRCGALVNDSRVVELWAAKQWTPRTGVNAMTPGCRVEFRRPGEDLTHTRVRNYPCEVA